LPQDVYQAGCERVIDKIWADNEGWFVRVGFDRALLKSCIMTRFYNAQQWGMVDQMAAWMKEHERPYTLSELRNLAEMTISSIDETLPKPAEVMTFLGECAEKLAEKNKPLSWTSLSGMPVSVRAYIPSIKTVQYKASGKLRQHKIARGREAKINERKAKRSAAPNFVHSCDAAHMALVTNRAAANGIVDLAMVHDSFGCPAGQAGRFRDIIREEFVRMYARKDVLADIRATARDLDADVDLPEVPARGTLDLEGVLRSDFAFD
jgi:DNA-directed RNA polymerase